MVMRKEMKKIGYLFSNVVTIATAMCCLMADARAESEIPRLADISVSGIFLMDSKSTSKTLGISPAPIESDDDFPLVQVCNSKTTEVLTLVFHYGSIRDSFSEFRVRNISNAPANSIMPPKGIDHFATGKGIRLGISKKDLIKILGPGFTEKKEGKQIIIHYKIDNFDQSDFLKKYNMPVYYGSYHFVKDKLVKFEFGFEYP